MEVFQETYLYLLFAFLRRYISYGTNICLFFEGINRVQLSFLSGY